MHLCSRTEEDIKSATTILSSSSTGKVSGSIVDVLRQEQIETWIQQIVDQEH